MRATAAGVVAAVVSSSTCVGLASGFIPTRSHPPIPTRVACRHGKAEGVAALAAGGDSPREGAAVVATDTPLSRARDVFGGPAFRNLLGPMGAAGALLGPTLDNYHSAFGVLTYKNPIELSVGGHLLVTTDWW